MDKKSSKIGSVIVSNTPDVKLLSAGADGTPTRLLAAGGKGKNPDLIMGAPIDDGNEALRTMVNRAKLNDGHNLYTESKKAEELLGRALIKNMNPEMKIEMDCVPRLCRLGVDYLRKREQEFPNLVEAREPLENKVLLAVLCKHAREYVGQMLGNNGEKTMGELKDNPSKDVVIVFIDEYSSIVENGDEILNSLQLKAEIPISAKETTDCFPITGPSSVNPVFLALSEEGVFEQLESLRAAEKYLESLIGDEPNHVIKAVTGPGGELVPLVTLENKLAQKIIGTRGDMRRNACFYLLSKSARKGMNQDIWPMFLREALAAEKWWTGLLISSRKGNEGTFLECGGGDGRCLVQEHERRGLGNKFTVFDYFGHIISVDYSWQMSYAASKSIARKIGKCGVERTRLILGELGDMGYLGSHSVDLAACLFNTFGNMNVRDQMHMSDHLNRVLRKFDPEGSPPAMAFFTVYRDRRETEMTQEEFYTSGMNMDIVERRERVTITRTQENGGTSNKYTFKSQRFIEDELKTPIESGGLVVLDVFPISTIMWGAVAVSSEVSNGHGSREELYNNVLGKTEIGKRIQEAKRRDALKFPNWNWDELIE